MRKVILVSLFFISGAVNAEVFKCTADDGEVTYGAVPCASGTNATVRGVKTATAVPESTLASIAEPSVSPYAGSQLLRDAERRADREKLDRRIARSQSQLAHEFDKIDTKFNSDMCALYVDRLKRNRDEQRSGASAGRSERLKAQAREHEQSRQRYCR